MKRHWSAGLFWLAVLVLTLSGCFFPGAGGPVSESGAVGGLPEPDPDHPKREECPVQEYGVEVEDISVMSGNNTALIQLQDMDGKRFLGDGGHLFPGPDADRPLKIYFFTKSTRILILPARWWRDRLLHLPGGLCGPERKRTKEVVVSWQMNTGAYLLGAYSLEETMSRNVQQAAVLLLRLRGGLGAQAGRPAGRGVDDHRLYEYSLYDLDQDTRTEIAVIQVDPAGTNSTVQLYGWRDGHLYDPGYRLPFGGNRQQRHPKCGRPTSSGGRKCAGAGPVYLQRTGRRAPRGGCGDLPGRETLPI